MTLALDDAPVSSDGGSGLPSDPPPVDPSPRRRLSTEDWVSLAIVAGAVIFTLAQLQPSLLVRNTTATGGDMGSHVWAADFVRRELLPQGRITGWAPDWYSGFPVLTFYFPLPTLLIVALDLLLPYNVAFKLVTVLGILTFPVAAWALGRLSRMPFPGPPLLSVAAVVFLFDGNFTIYGGNIASTLAGEFSFSISLSFALLYLGVVARGLDTSRRRALAAVLLGLTGLSHLLPTIFAVVGTGVFFLIRPAWRRLRASSSVLSVGALLAAFWSFPFLLRLPYANDMGWGKLTDYRTQLVPANLRWVVVLALVGAAFSFERFRRLGMFLTGMAGVSALVFRFAPQGRLWNARALPFWFLCVYLLAAIAIAELGPAIARGLSRRVDHPGLLARLATPIAGALAVWILIGQPLGVVPSWIPIGKTTATNFVPGWAKWNYEGYEAKAAYPEYRGLMDTMTQVGSSRGCGRAHWEYEEDQNRFGTPMALMLLPYWTRGCIGSMEGLYFESSATTPYHFLNAGELSAKPSNPQRDLPYAAERPNLDSGIRNLQLLGTRYYLAFSPEAVAQAEVHPDLIQVATSGQWRVYEVAGSELVEPLVNEPAVLTGVAKGGKDWLGVGAQWYTKPELRDVLWAADGPPSWSRIAVSRTPTESAEVNAGVEVEEPERRKLPEVKVTKSPRSDKDGGLSFEVDRPGVPVLVKMSYFPNWRAKGAEGPWRVAPNLMVVIPTSRQVSLSYGWTPTEVFGWMLTAGGIATVVIWWRRRGETPEVEVVGGDGDPGSASVAGQDEARQDGAPAEKVPESTAVETSAAVETSTASGASHSAGTSDPEIVIPDGGAERRAAVPSGPG